MRAVVDTNVLLSALVGRHTSALLPALIGRRFQPVTSPPLIEELLTVLNRPRWIRLVPPRDVSDLLAALHEVALIVTPTHHVRVCRDPDDNAVLDCALAGGADCIVTGDRDLLVLHPFRGIRILRPAEFLRLVA